MIFLFIPFLFFLFLPRTDDGLTYSFYIFATLTILLSSLLFGFFNPFRLYLFHRSVPSSVFRLVVLGLRSSVWAWVYSVHFFMFTRQRYQEKSMALGRLLSILCGFVD